MKSSKSQGCDSAFKLLYLILTAEFNESDINKEKQKMYNAVFFIMSHSVIFKYCTHKILRAIYEKWFQPSEKQIAKMNQWLTREPEKNEWRKKINEMTEISYSSDSSDEYDWE